MNSSFRARLFFCLLLVSIFSASIVGAANCKKFKIHPGKLANGTVGVFYSAQLTTTGSGGGPVTFSMSSGTLPAGVSMSSGGLISGTAAAGGVFTFTAHAVANNGCTRDKTYTIIFNNPGCPTITLTPFTVFNGTLGVPYSQAFSASGGTTPYTFSISGGTALPDGLGLDANTGVVSGTPILVGAFGFTMTVTDTNGCFGSQPYIINITCPTITLSPSTLPAGTVGTAYSQQLSAFGGAGTYTFAKTAGNLPTGLTLSATGLLSGTTTVANSFSFTVTATDSNNCTGSQNYVVDVNAVICPTLSMAPSSLPDADVNVAYDQTVIASGGTSPYTYAKTSGTFPTGLSMDTAGNITGTPTVTGLFAFTITATDANGCKDSAAYAINVNCPPFQFFPSTLPGGTVSTAYSQTVSVTGGTAPYAFDATSGSLPTGLLLDSVTGNIAGTPTQAGSFSFLLTATDSDANACTDDHLYDIDINGNTCPSILVTPITISNGVVGTAYTQTFGAGGGTGPYAFEISGGTLPPGLTLDEVTGVLSGTPTTAGGYSFTVTATDASGCKGSQAYSMDVACSDISLSPLTLPATSVGAGYNQQITAVGGTGTYTFLSGPGALPNGLGLNTTTGVLSGTATKSGSFTFLITAVDGNGCTGSLLYSIDVNAATCPTITLSPTSLPDGTLGVAYDQTVTPSGGTAPYNFSINGSIPSGILLNTSTGELSGIPTATGDFLFSVSATDTNGCHTSGPYLVHIVCPTITLSPAALPAVTVNTAYSQPVSAAGGNDPYSYTVSSGTIPPGLTLDSVSGVISGTPTSVGSFSFNITATDEDGCTGTKLYTIDVNPAACPTITLTPATLSDGVVGSSYTDGVAGQNGAGGYTYSITGSVPPGLGLNGVSGAFTGTPTAAGTYSFSISATDTNGCKGSQLYSIDVTCPVITVSPTTLSAVTVGQTVNQPFAGANGVGTYTYHITAGTLPNGVTLSLSGLLSGAPTQPGTFTFTVTATDQDGCSGSQQVSLTVTCIFCDDFNDLNFTTPLWTVKKGTWSAATGDAVGTVTKKGDLLSPAFTCTNCTFESRMKVQSTGRVSLFAWYEGKSGFVELRLSQDKQTILLKQRKGAAAAKKKVLFAVNANQFYDMKVVFNGTDFQVTVDGVPIPGLTMNKVGTPVGSAKFRAKSPTGVSLSGTFAEIFVY